MQLNASDVARLCGVTEPTVHDWVERLALPAARDLTQYQIQPAALLDWASRHQVQVAPSLFRSRPADRRPSASLSASLQRGGVVTCPGHVDHASLFRAMVEALPLPNVDCAEQFAILSPHGAGAASLGDDVAVPHPHHPIVLPIDEPALRICYLDQPLDLPTLDGKRVDVLLLLVSPTVRAHLQLLARATHALRSPELRDALRRRRGLDAVTAVLRRLEGSAPAAVPSDAA